MHIEWNGVTSAISGNYHIVQGCNDGTVVIRDIEKGISFIQKVHSCNVADVILIEETETFAKICSCDESGRFLISTFMTPQHNSEFLLSTKSEYTLPGHVSQMVSLYPSQPLLFAVTKTGMVIAINFQTGEIRKADILTDRHVDIGFGLINLKNKRLFISFLSKNILKIAEIDVTTLDVISLFSCGLTSSAINNCKWTKLITYCERFMACYSERFLAILDPVSKITLNVIEITDPGELLLAYSDYANICIVKRTMNSEIQTIMLSQSDLLFVPRPQIENEEYVFKTFSETSLPQLESSFHSSMSNSAKVSLELSGNEPDQSVTQSQSTNHSQSYFQSQSNTQSRSYTQSDDSLPNPAEISSEVYPKLPDWTERRSSPTPQVLLGLFASDSNLPPRQSSEKSEPDETEKSCHHSHPEIENTESQDNKPSMRPAVSADDRLMRLFFPADYDNQCPFPSKPVEDSGESETNDSSQEIIYDDPAPVIGDEDIDPNSVPNINFLEYWPIWLEMPLGSPYALAKAGGLFGNSRPTSLSMSRHHIYVTDTSQRLSYASLDFKSVNWHVVADIHPANQVSVSPNGEILWLLRSGSVYTAQTVSASAPVGKRWDRILLDVTYIHVTDGKAFYIRRDGALMMQNGLSGRRPSYVSVQLHTPFRLKSVVVSGSEVWGQCADGRVVFNDRLLAVRSTALSARRDETFVGEWEVDKYCPPDACRIISLYVGPFNTVIAIDEFCKMWFRRSKASPSCCLTDRLLPCSKAKFSDEWWLVPMPNRNQDGYVDNIPKVWPLFVASCRDSIVLSAPSPATGSLQLYLSKGQLLGQQLRRIRPKGSALTTRWRSVHFVEPFRVGKSRRSFSWLVGETGELLKLDLASLNAISPSPSDLRSGCVRNVSVGQDVTWVLLESGAVWACHHDSDTQRWAQLDMAQLTEEYFPIVDVAVGPRLVWLLSATGALFFRIGTGAIMSDVVSQPALCHLNDDQTSCDHNEIAIRRIYASPKLEWMLYALPVAKRPQNAKSRTYQMCPLARMGITTDVPIGATWHPIIGSPEMKDLSISAEVGLLGIPMSTSLDFNGSAVYWRSGVQERDPTGSYWRKVIDGVEQVSVGDDHAQLCLIGTDGSLYVHAVCCLSNNLNTESKIEETAVGDWEVI